MRVTGISLCVTDPSQTAEELSCRGAILCRVEFGQGDFILDLRSNTSSLDVITSSSKPRRVRERSR